MARKLYLSFSLAEPHGSLPLSSSPRPSHTPVARLFRLQCWGRAPSLSRFLFAPRSPSKPPHFEPSVASELSLGSSIPSLLPPPPPPALPPYLSRFLFEPFALLPAFEISLPCYPPGCFADSPPLRSLFAAAKSRRALSVSCSAASCSHN